MAHIPTSPSLRLVNAVLASARPQHHRKLGITTLVSILARCGAQRVPTGRAQKARLSDSWFLGPEIIIIPLKGDETSSKGPLLHDNDLKKMGPKRIWNHPCLGGWQSILIRTHMDLGTNMRKLETVSQPKYDGKQWKQTLEISPTKKILETWLDPIN